MSLQRYTTLLIDCKRFVVLQIKIISQSKEDMGTTNCEQKHLSPTKDMQRGQQAGSPFSFSGWGTNTKGGANSNPSDMEKKVLAISITENNSEARS